MVIFNMSSGRTPQKHHRLANTFLGTSLYVSQYVFVRLGALRAGWVFPGGEGIVRDCTFLSGEGFKFQ